jgi:hypothetical protein
MLPSGLSEIVDDDEPLLRFLTHRNHFAAHRVKAEAYFPARADNKTSVFRQGAVPRVEVWLLADQNLGERHVRAVAMCRAISVRKADLRVEPDEPPPRHANLSGWPAPGDAMDKAKLKEIAAALAESAELITRDRD